MELEELGLFHNSLNGECKNARALARVRAKPEDRLLSNRNFANELVGHGELTAY